jgi:hypothetical protein
MEDEIKASKQRETLFRRGACHAAHWLSKQTLALARERKTAEQIADHVSDLEEVLTDWRNHTNPDLPNGNPWDWPKPTLVDYIAKQKDS